MFGTTKTFVIYPARGFMGASAVLYVEGGDLAAIKAQGATDRARFDLAMEVVVPPRYGAQWEGATLKAPAEWRKGAAALGIAA